MKHRLLVASLLSLCTLCAAVPAQAQFKTPEDAIKYRQAALRVMSTHFGRLAAMAQGKVPYDPKIAGENADVVVVLSKLPFPAFAEGTDMDAPSHAKPEVWKEMPRFNEAAEKMQAAAAKLPAAARSGDLAQLKAAVGATGQSCKACHDHFRSE
ncbi:MAG TPA: cytochrome c [Burkholderiaceae bacterium]|jgi:cytochrome c556